MDYVGEVRVLGKKIRESMTRKQAKYIESREESGERK